MTIQEAIKAHKAGKKVRHKIFVDNECVEIFNNASYNTNVCSLEQDFTYTLEHLDGWEIIEEPLTADELRKGIEWIYDLSEDYRFKTESYLADLLNNKRIWED